MTDGDSKGALNPLKLAATLHWHPDDGVAARNIESKRVLDYWLVQLEHFDSIFAPEYLEAPALLGELLIEEAEHADRLVRIQEDDRFHHWGLCQHLLAESERAVAASAVLSRDFSELGVVVAMHLDPGHYHLSWTEDIRAKAWCIHADACRRLNLGGEALAALGEAIKHARKGTASAELAARIEKTEMSLSRRTDGRRWNGGGRLPVGAPLPIRVADDPSSHSRVS
ncbi:MAG: hypothetical protein KDB94_09605 [Acidobacteria bacterium]|nr:hypothetical protein [Acidobacteriota bacterium]